MNHLTACSASVNPNRFCLDLDLGFVVDNSFINALDVSDIDPCLGAKQFDIDLALLDPLLWAWLRTQHLSLRHAEVFYTLPGKSLPIHIDDDQFDDHCKLNFVYGGDGSLMQWWRQKDPAAPLQHKKTAIGTTYVVFDPNDCDLIWTAQVGCPSLVNAGQPHSVLNCTAEPRVTLSLVLESAKGHLVPWDQAAEMLGKFSKVSS